MHALLFYPLALTATYISITLTFLALHMALPSVQILGFIFRCLAAYFGLISCAIYGTVASLILRLLNLHYKYAQYTTARAFKWTAIYTMGVKFSISPADAIEKAQLVKEGDGQGQQAQQQQQHQRRRPLVIVANHQTELDILFLGWIWPKNCSVTAKRSLAYIPFLGWFMTLSGAIFIDRFDRNQALKAFEGAARVMRDENQSVLIFPEGTRSYSDKPTLLPFKKGAFHLAIQSGADILPVVAENYSRILNVKAKRFNPGTIRVKVLDPISTKGLTAADVSQLTEDTRNKMLAALNDLAQEQAQSETQAAVSSSTTSTTKQQNGKPGLKEHIS